MLSWTEFRWVSWPVKISSLFGHKQWLVVLSACLGSFSCRKIRWLCMQGATDLNRHCLGVKPKKWKSYFQLLCVSAKHFSAVVCCIFAACNRNRRPQVQHSLYLFQLRSRSVSLVSSIHQCFCLSQCLSHFLSFLNCKMINYIWDWAHPTPAGTHLSPASSSSSLFILAPTGAPCCFICKSPLWSQRPFNVNGKYSRIATHNKHPALFITSVSIPKYQGVNQRNCLFNEHCYSQKVVFCSRCVLQDLHCISPPLCCCRDWGWAKQMDPLTQRTILRHDRWRDVFNWCSV